MNKKTKSSDLIGIQPVLITQEMVGTVIGRFVAEECKHSGWKWKGTEREIAQANFHEIVIAHGGYASFISEV